MKAFGPLRTSVPPLTLIEPANVFVPERVATPAPVLLMLCG